MRFTRTISSVPVVKECTWIRNNPVGFIAAATFEDLTRIEFDVAVLAHAYPAVIANLYGSKSSLTPSSVPILMAPFVSKESGELCEKLLVGYMDMSGNALIRARWMYIREYGNPNLFIQEQKSAKNIFNPTSRVSSLILRELLRDMTRPWKLSLLATHLGCSIGQVSKVKNFLCDQLWADMSNEGLRIIDAEAIMDAWSEEYGLHVPRLERMDCYTLLPIAEFEAHIQHIIDKNDYTACFTGLSGGVRYTPVVRYNTVDLLVHERDAEALMTSSGCKQVDSGANVHMWVVEGTEWFHDERIIRSERVASPVQVVLDCMNIKGRGEEMARAVFEKEIAR